MRKVIILRGIPASGKTTKARELVLNNPRTKRINRDDLRKMLDFGEYSIENEDIIKLLQMRIVEELLVQDYSVVIDDTNIKDITVDWWTIFIKSVRSDIEIEVFWIDTPLQECIERDAKRKDSVGENVIKALYEQKQFNNSNS
ncbi:MAG: AAA family ATPase [Candidatus Omnitrophica bacterium]|jgi:predicted kinase|nr:AAA family ATPase [Candidatus Omnitrophota bacterium]